MSDFYKIQLLRFANDRGFTGRARPLTRRERDLSGDELNAAQETADADGRFRDVDERVIFEASPVVSESRGAEYVDRALPGPTGIIVYTATQNRRFSINGRFISRTVEEAMTNYGYVNCLRSWMVPQSTDGKTGRPPIIRLNGYKQQFFNIPVVLSDLSITFPEDVDYIDTGSAMVPIIQNIEMTLIESHRRASNDNRALTGEANVSDDTRSEFNLADFKAGTLPGY